MRKRIALAILTHNAGENFEKVIELVNKQRREIDEIKIYDSESKDKTLEIVKSFGINFDIVKKDQFSHSGTRTKVANEMYDKGYDYLIFMSQDIYLQPNAFRELKTFIENSKLAMAYGKQEVDMNQGKVFEYFAREYNYPRESQIKGKNDITKKGIKTIFCSDAFAIYDLFCANKMGYFGDEVNFAEDMLIAHKFIQNDMQIGYCSKAKVFHTHDYSMIDEFNRYRAIGKFHNEQQEILNQYGQVSSEGIKLALNEIKYLISIGKVIKIPESILRNAIKYVGMKMGYYVNL